MVAEDHAEVRKVLVSLINSQPDMEAVGEASDGLEAVRLVNVLSPHVLLLDIRMPGMDGIAVISELRRCNSPVRIIAVSAHDDDAYISEAIRRGADGYILKGVPTRRIIEAVREVAKGKTVLPPEAAEPLARRYREDEAVLKALFAMLEKREDGRGMLGGWCRAAAALVGAGSAAVYRLKGGGSARVPELLLHFPENEQVAEEWRSVPRSDLLHLAELAWNDRPVACNDYSFSGDGGMPPGVKAHFLVIPLHTEEAGDFMLLCRCGHPFALHSSLTSDLVRMSTHAGILMDNCRRREKVAFLERRLEAARKLALSLLTGAGDEQGPEAVFAALALLLDACGVFLVRLNGESAGPRFLEGWNVKSAGAVNLVARLTAARISAGLQPDTLLETALEGWEVEELLHECPDDPARLYLLPIPPPRVGEDVDEGIFPAWSLPGGNGEGFRDSAAGEDVPGDALGLLGVVGSQPREVLTAAWAELGDAAAALGRLIFRPSRSRR
jgi:DNA-binding NarL/FixJ family response regulator